MYIVWCVHHAKSSFLPSPFIAPSAGLPWWGKHTQAVSRHTPASANALWDTPAQKVRRPPHHSPLPGTVPLCTLDVSGSSLMLSAPDELCSVQCFSVVPDSSIVLVHVVYLPQEQKARMEYMEHNIETYVLFHGMNISSWLWSEPAIVSKIKLI